MGTVSETMAVLQAHWGLAPSADADEPNVWRARVFARSEPGNDRKQDLEVHVVKDEWHEGVVLRSVVAAVKNSVALAVSSRYRDMYGSVQFQAIDEDSGYLSLVTHIPLAPFTLSDPQALSNFVAEFVGRADRLEEAILGDSDYW